MISKILTLIFIVFYFEIMLGMGYSLNFLPITVEFLKNYVIFYKNNVLAFLKAIDI